MEGEVNTLLPGGSTKKFHCRWEGEVNGRRSEDFITGRESTKKVYCRWEGVSGRRSEYFITGREHKNSLPVRGGVGVWEKV